MDSSKAIILVDHGSYRVEANELLERMAERLQEQLPGYMVQPAHMELVEPSISRAFTLCIQKGAKEIIVFPYFLSPGRHTKEDIPRYCKEAGERFPAIKYRIADPLGEHDKIIEIILERAGLI